jgi:hypothetical protein
MSGSGLWFSRFASAGEGWLPLVAFGSAAWVLWSVAQAPEMAEDLMAPVAHKTAAGPQGQADRQSVMSGSAVSASP